MIERISGWLLIKLLKHHAANYMDQWDSYVFKTEHGPIYVDISRKPNGSETRYVKV